MPRPMPRAGADPVHGLAAGDRCEFRYPARKQWHPGVVVKQGGAGYWSVRHDGDRIDYTNEGEPYAIFPDGKLVESIYGEHVRPVQGLPLPLREAAHDLARYGRENADQEFPHLDALEDHIVGAILAQVTDPDYEQAEEAERWRRQDEGAAGASS